MQYPRSEDNWKRNCVQILTKRLNQATTSAQPETNDSELDIVPKRKRGRPTSISVEAKQKALAARRLGAHGKEIAQLLYEVRRPTTRQVKDVSKVLKHYEQSLERAKS
jgi:hypothetical protein